MWTCLWGVLFPVAGRETLSFARRLKEVEAEDLRVLLGGRSSFMDTKGKERESSGYICKTPDCWGWKRMMMVINECWRCKTHLFQCFEQQGGILAVLAKCWLIKCRNEAYSGISVWEKAVLMLTTATHCYFVLEGLMFSVSIKTSVQHSLPGARKSWWIYSPPFSCSLAPPVARLRLFLLSHAEEAQNLPLSIW